MAILTTAGSPYDNVAAGDNLVDELGNPLTDELPAGGTIGASGPSMQQIIYYPVDWYFIG